VDIFKTLAELHAERKQVEQAILLVERVAAATRGKRLSRPPKWMSLVNKQGPGGNCSQEETRGERRTEENRGYSGKAPGRRGGAS